jgi:hypothetical protein
MKAGMVVEKWVIEVTDSEEFNDSPGKIRLTNDIPDDTEEIHMRTARSYKEIHDWLNAINDRDLHVTVNHIKWMPMEKHVIEVNYDDELYGAHHSLWLTNDDLYKREEVATQTAMSVAEALEMYDDNKHRLILIYSDKRESLPLKDLTMLCASTLVPIMLVTKKDANFRGVFHGVISCFAFDKDAESPNSARSNLIDAKSLIHRYICARYGVPFFSKLVIEKLAGQEHKAVESVW